MQSLKARICAAGRELYERGGAEGLSMRRVAEMVGVTAPAIYRHYRNKEELLGDIVAEGLRILEDYLKPAFEAESPRERLLRMADGYLTFALEQPRYFDFAFLVPNPGQGRVAEELARPDWGTFRLAVEQVAACMEQGAFAPGDPLEAAIVLWAEVHGLVALYRTGRLGQDPLAFRETYRRSIRRVLDGLKHQA